MTTPPFSNIEAALDRAFALHRAGQVERARDAYLQLRFGHPAHPRLLFLLGTAELQLGRYADAVASLGASLKLDPDQEIALSNCGIGLLALERTAEALACFDRALALAPDQAKWHYNRGNALRNLGRADEALQAYDRAIALDPGDACFYNNRGTLLKDIRRPEAALVAFDRAVALDPNFAEAHSNRGNILKTLGRHDDALAAYDCAIALGGDASFKYNKARLLLLTGDFKAGWKLYEQRWQRERSKSFVRRFSQPRWLKDRPVKNKTVLLYGEQGFGDTVQFVRYAPMVAALGAKVVIEVQKDVLPLLAGLGDFVLIERGKPLPAFDLQCPMMSLPLAFKTRLDTVPANVPYLSADPARIAQWRRRLGPKRAPRIGIAWAGRAAFDNDVNRSIPLATMAPLIAGRFEFHALQKEISSADAVLLHTLSVSVHAGDLRDFADTAALIAEMDMVISVDTSIAHVAGAIGKPVWILLPFAPDWRWLLQRTDSPWYPTALLFRQPAFGDWDAVIETAAQELEKKSF